MAIKYPQHEQLDKLNEDQLIEIVTAFDSLFIRSMSKVLRSMSSVPDKTKEQLMSLWEGTLLMVVHDIVLSHITDKRIAKDLKVQNIETNEKQEGCVNHLTKIARHKFEHLDEDDQEQVAKIVNTLMREIKKKAA